MRKVMHCLATIALGVFGGWSLVWGIASLILPLYGYSFEFKKPSAPTYIHIPKGRVPEFCGDAGVNVTIGGKEAAVYIECEESK